MPSLTLCKQLFKHFHEKIAVIRSFPSPLVFDPATSPICPVVFENFAQVSLPFLTDIVKHLRPSYCPSDIIPPCLLKDVFSTFGLCIVDLINSSLLAGCVPAAFKHAVVQPSIKKSNLDPAVLSNFRPISKLPFLSKVLEKVVYDQLKLHIDLNGISEKFQSGFKS